MDSNVKYVYCVLKGRVACNIIVRCNNSFDHVTVGNVGTYPVMKAAIGLIVVAKIGHDIISHHGGHSGPFEIISATFIDMTFLMRATVFKSISHSPE